MKTFALATATAIAIATLSTPALAMNAQSGIKVEARIIAIDQASGMVQLSNGLTFNQTNAIQSAALQHLYETEGAHQLQRKLRSQIRYVANDAKA